MSKIINMFIMLVLSIFQIPSVTITAHRGYGVRYPENTMEAFIAAYNDGADYIEFDVQQTKDQKLIIMHDDNFKRTANIDKFVYDVNYSEVTNYRVQDSKIPLLDDVLDYFKDKDVKLNIELKSNGHEKNYVDSVLSLVYKYNIKNKVVISSMDYNLLKSVKLHDSTIKTALVIRKNCDDISKYTYADEFNIKKIYVNKNLVRQIHSLGKKIGVWVINNKSEVKSMLKLGVDNIITDDVKTIRNYMYSLF